MKTLSRQSGFSLIEILVALVLLLIGIFSVIRLFPPGFLINKNTEATTLASRLAKQEADRYASNPGNLMDNIAPVVYEPTSRGFRVDLNVTPDDLTVATGDFAYYYSDVNKIRRILGETVRIPLPSPTAAGRGSIYLLSAGPFMDVTWDGQSRSLFIQGGPMNRVIASAADSYGPVLRGPGQYAIDYESGKIAFSQAGYPRQFLLTFSYYDEKNQVQTVVDKPFPDTSLYSDGFLPASYGGDWMSIQLPDGARGLVPESETVARRFAEVATGGFTDDPYQYYLLSPNIGGLANIGVVVFNPRGRDQVEFTPSGPVPLSARIDYDVLDWRIIREDRSMPAGAPYQVALSLKGLKQRGDTEEDQSTYPGLFPVSGDQPDIMIYDVANGVLVPPTGNGGTPNYVVNYHDGTVTFSDDFGAANPSGVFRFFYKATGNWALQIQKASTSYRRHTASGSGDEANVGLGEFYLGNGTVGSATRMYFPLTDAGKTVQIRELWYSTGNSTARGANESYRINDNRAFFETFNVNGTPRRLTWIDLKDRHSDATGWNSTDAGQAAIGVQGISFKSRVLWSAGATVNQTPGGNVVRYNWRKVDLDTILTRSSN